MKTPRATLLFLTPLLMLAILVAAHGEASAAPESVDGLGVSLEGSSLVVTRGSIRWTAPIPIDRSRIDPASLVVESIPIGEGKRVVHAKVPDRERRDLAFEALFTAAKDAPIWAGLTGYTRGADGDRSGEVLFVSDRDATSKFVIVAETREDTRICGQATTALSPRGLDPKTLELRGATLHRLGKTERDAASPIIATAVATKAPLARLLAATGGSAPLASLLTDGDPATTWSEQRPGDGHGEFATLRAPAELELRSLVVTPAPPAGKREAPRTFYVATDKALFHVTMPEDAKPGQAYEIPLPSVKTSCVAVVLDDAYAHGKDAPEVGIAELVATTRFDAEGASLADVARALASTRGEEAAALLRRAGEKGLDAVVTAYPSYAEAGPRALAVDIASSAGTCEAAAGDLLTRALADSDLEVRKRAMGRIERCGKKATTALTLAVASDDERKRSAAAPLLASIAPSAAIAPLVDQLGKGSTETRRAMRSALGRVVTSSTRDKLLGLLTVERPLVARLDLLRALGPKLHELRPESDAAIADVLRSTPDFATRYVLVQPLAQLARSGDATTGELTRLSEIIKHDPEWAVRARAMELAAGIGPLMPAVAGAARDPEPRVREAALKALGASHVTQANVVSAALERDEWTFVRVAAAEALGAMPADPDATSSLDKGLDDKSPKVRLAVVLSLAQLKATAAAPRLRERLDDGKEDADVRAASARALGAICAQSATDRLTKLALVARSPANEADDRIGMAAIDALGALHPTDLEKRLEPLRDKAVRPPVRRAAERALSAASECR